MKPILFNTEMVQAILDGRKGATRRVVKPQPFSVPKMGKQPYFPGDILYVRETWQHKRGGGYLYKTDHINSPDLWITPDGRVQSTILWRPSIHMPKEAARLFLRVTDVRVERLQDIDGRSILAEGIDNGRSNPTMGKRWENMQRMAFSDVWDSTIKKADRPRYGWEANPWVWVIEFERISKEEAQKGGEGNEQLH